MNRGMNSLTCSVIPSIGPFRTTSCPTEPPLALVQSTTRIWTTALPRPYPDPSLRRTRMEREKV